MTGENMKNQNATLKESEPGQAGKPELEFVVGTKGYDEDTMHTIIVHCIRSRKIGEVILDSTSDLSFDVTTRKYYEVESKTHKEYLLLWEERRYQGNRDAVERIERKVVFYDVIGRCDIETEILEE
jgi:hypothetical protein